MFSQIIELSKCHVLVNRNLSTYLSQSEKALNKLQFNLLTRFNIQIGIDCVKN